MIAAFKNRRPVHAPAPAKTSREDIQFAYYWGLTLTEWEALPSLVKADKREDVVHAPNFRAAA
jgi:hypothetical protein